MVVEAGEGGGGGEGPAMQGGGVFYNLPFLPPNSEKKRK
jgi:hypothetical protein